MVILGSECFRKVREGKRLQSRLEKETSLLLDLLGFSDQGKIVQTILHSTNFTGWLNVTFPKTCIYVAFSCPKQICWTPPPFKMCLLDSFACNSDLKAQSLICFHYNRLQKLFIIYLFGCCSRS